MGGWLGLLWVVLLLGAATWLAAALLAPSLAGRLADARACPAVRRRRLLLAAAFPWVVPGTLVAAVLSAALAKLVGLIADHCPEHPGISHPHLCFAHLPAIELDLVSVGVVAGLAVLLSAGAVRLAWSLRGAKRELGSLAALSGARGRVRILPVSAPIALAGGVARPLVVLSRGLLDELSFRERRIVAAHEIAHLRHGDARRNVLFEILLLAHLPWARARLRRAWLASLEELADDAVARRFGACNVVETLLHVARIHLRGAAPAFSIAGVDVPARAHRLLQPEAAHGRSSPAFETGYVLLLVAAFALVVLDHHLLESLLAPVVGR